MKVKIQNFGPIKEFEFDTGKKFHIIVGENNIGKSYALTVFYFVIKTILDTSSISMYNRRMYVFGALEEEDESFASSLQQELTNIVKGKANNVDVSAIYNPLATEILQHAVAEEFSKRVKSSYFENSSIVNSYSSAESSVITITTKNMSFSLCGNVGGFKVKNFKYVKTPIFRESVQNRSPIVSGEKLVIYRDAAEKPESLFLKLKDECLRRVFYELVDSVGNIIDADYLPASRSGLYQALSAFSQIIAELSKSRSFLSSRVELPGISGQLSDYFIKLSNIKSDNYQVAPFEELASKIESDVLKGRIEYDFDEKRLYYTPERTDLKLDISTASSMVSETAPIVAYIRHIIAWSAERPKTKRHARYSGNIKELTKILIIEEPEAHLHPFNQIKMTRYYAELARLGVTVILTSHSNYVFNKVGNLILEGVLDHKQVKCDHFVMTEHGSIGHAQEVDELGIEDGTFSDASEDLLKERFALLDKDFSND